MNVDGLEALIHDRTNAARRQHGESSVAYDPALRPIARYHSHRQANAGRIFHEAPDGETLSDRLEKHGYDVRSKATGQRFCQGCGADLRHLASPRHCSDCGAELSPRNAAAAAAGENLAYRGAFGRSEDDPETVASEIVAGWLDSPEHRENLLDERFDREAIGIAVVRDAGVELYVTQVFS